jgi:hypothetical protein
VNKPTGKIEAASFSADVVNAFSEIEGAAKDKLNPHFKSKYADLTSVIDAIKPVLSRHNLAFYQRPQPSESGILVQTVLRHASGEEIDLGTLYVPANKNDPQGFGSAMTYARRYALMTAFGVPAEDDDGNAAAKASGADKVPDRPTTGEERPVKRSDEKPFALGPAKNKTSLKELGRAFWKDVEACGDEDELTALVASSKPLIDQLKAELPTWWDGGFKDGGEPFEGLSHVIDRNLNDFRNLANARTVIDAG